MSLGIDVKTKEIDFKTLFNQKDEKGNVYHSFDKNKLEHIKKWIDKKINLYHFLQSIWKHPNFFPCYSIEKSQNIVENHYCIIIRLSTRKPGYITITHPKSCNDTYHFRIKIDDKGNLIYKNKKINCNEFIDEVNGECLFCLEKYNKSENMTHSCGKTFHKKCLENWLKIKPECPNCKQYLQFSDCKRYILDTLKNENKILEFGSYSEFKN